MSLTAAKLFLSLNAKVQTLAAVFGSVYVRAGPPWKISVISLLYTVPETTATGGIPDMRRTPFLGTVRVFFIRFPLVLTVSRLWVILTRSVQVYASGLRFGGASPLGQDICSVTGAGFN